MGEKGLTLKDGLLRETLASRSFADKSLKVEGDVGMSTGILMQAGSLEVLGNAGKNMGVLQSGGELIVRIPPVKMKTLKGDETGKVAKILKINGLQAMAYKKFSL